MPLTVRDLMAQPGLGLSLLAGEAGLDRPIAWAHISELRDPTAWLTGSELLLTTGMDLEGTAADQRTYIERLVAANLSGLGFGVGFNHDRVPPAMVEAAERAGFPLLEVPYPVPFIAITKAVSARLTEDRVKDAQMSVEVHERLASLVSQGTGPADVLDELARLTGGSALLFDLRGEILAKSAATDEVVLDSAALWADLPEGLKRGTGAETASQTSAGGTWAALAVGAGSRREAVLVFAKRSKLDQRDRIAVRHAVTLLGLLLASRRAVIETERRIAGDVLSDAFAGRVSGAELERRLALLGFARDGLSVLVIEPVAADDLNDLEWVIDSALTGRVGAVRTATIGDRVAALVEHSDAESLARYLVEDSATAAPAVRVGVGQSVATAAIRSSYMAALFSLKATPSERPVASYRDLGSYGFLLGAQSTHVLETFVDSVLGPLIERDADKSSELVASVRAYIRAGGHWERGAEELGVHRHTLRYRIQQAEDLLARDLSDAEERLELWLALKAREILSE